jgi:hypothetical protein
MSKTPIFCHKFIDIKMTNIVHHIHSISSLYAPKQKAFKVKTWQEHYLFMQHNYILHLQFHSATSKGKINKELESTDKTDKDWNGKLGD